jgi:hypothetical protein
MTTIEMPFEEIDVESEIFRISEELNMPAILESLREIGQLNPVILMERGERNIVVCGFRRVRAMKNLGLPRILVRRLPKDSDPSRAFAMALWDNLSHRQLDPLEKARVLSNLRNHFGVPEDAIIRDYLPLLALSPAANVLRSYLLLHRIHPALRKCLAEGRLTHSSLSAIAAMPEAVQNRIAPLMDKIRLSSSFQKKFLRLLDDLASTTKIQPEEQLNRPEILEILEDSRLSPFQRGEKVYEALYRFRNPRLSQATDQFLAQLKGIQLPGAIRIRAHPFFEEPGLHVEFDAADPEGFQDLAAALQQAAGSLEFKNLFVVR